MKRIRPFWLRICVILVLLLPVTVGNNDSIQCNDPLVSIAPLADYEANKDRGGLNGMCDAAGDIIHDMIRDEYPYDFAAQQAKLWHDTGRVDSSDVMGTVCYYFRDVVYIASFFVFLGIAIPVMASIFWFLWQQCDEDQDDEMKNSSYREQMFAWVLGMGLLLSCISMVVFVSLLLVGSSLIQSGSTDSSDAVIATLPQAVTLRNKTIDAINLSLLTELVDLLDSFNISIASFNCTGVSETQVFDKMDTTFNASSDLHGLLSELYATDLRGVGSGSLTVSSALSQLQASLDSLVQACGGEDLPANLTGSCDKLPKEISQPDEISDDAVNVLDQLRNATANSMQLVEKNRQAYKSCQNSTADGLVDQIDIAYSHFEEEVINEATQEVNHILLPMRRLHLGLPHSQQQAEDFTTNFKLVKVWKEIVYSRSLLFSVIVLLLLLCICYAMARGSYNIYYIYLCGNDPLFVRRAHQAGMMLKKLAYCFYIVCFVSSIGMTMFMMMSAVVVGTCGQSRNFTEIMVYVFDDKETWGGEYPLAKMVLDNPDYPLGYYDVLTRCSHGDNIYDVLDLKQNNFSVDNYHPVTSTLNNFTNKMSKVSMKACQILDDDLDDDLYSRLLLLENVTLEITSRMTRWRDYVTQLESSSKELANLNSVLSEMEKDLSSNYSYSVISTFSLLVQEVLTNVNTSLQLLNASRMSKMLDDGNMKISEQNITALLLLFEEEDFDNSLLECYNKATKNITNRIIDDLLQFEELAPFRAECNISTCQEIALLYNKMSAGMCKDLLDGMDLSWASLACIFVISIAIIVLNLVLASRFVDYTLTRVVKFSLWDSGLRQMVALVWLLLLVAIDIWVVSDIRSDDEFPAYFCEGRGSSCCASCVWGFGILFVILVLLIGLSSRLYQCLLVYRINNAYDQFKVRKYFHNRKKSIQFYTQLFMFILQDIPFLIISGTYLISMMGLTVSVQICMVFSVIDIIVYIIYIIRERKNVHSYVAWGRQELQNYYACLSKQRTTETSRYSPGYNHGSNSDDEDDPNHRYLDTSHSPNHGASDEFVYEGYPDQESSTNHTVAEVELHPPYLDEEERQLQMIGAEDYELEETESEISDTDAEQSESGSHIGRLDQPNPNTEAVQLRQEAAQLHARVTYGVEVATPLVTTSNPYQSGASNLDNSYMFSSIGSFEPTTSQYESSDNRDDDESDHDNKWHKFGQFYTVDV